MDPPVGLSYDKRWIDGFVYCSLPSNIWYRIHVKRILDVKLKLEEGRLEHVLHVR